MKERPMLFSGAMVKALLDGSKSQTRRVVKTDCLNAAMRKIGFEQNFELANPGDLSWMPMLAGKPDAELKREQQLNVPVRHPDDKNMPWIECGQERIYCQCGSVGDRLWVKETFAIHPEVECEIMYRANRGGDYQGAAQGDFKWKPSIFMPRHRSRITLEITGVRVERLREISEADAVAEGCEAGTRYYGTAYRDYRGKHGAWFIKAKQSYQTLWNSINLKPNPIYVTGEDGKKRIVSYECFPWSDEDFDKAYPGVRTTGLFRGKPIVVTANPWVWVVEFKRVVGGTPTARFGGASS